jgi:hypothetical protein
MPLPPGFRLKCTRFEAVLWISPEGWGDVHFLLQAASHEQLPAYSFKINSAIAF